MPLCPAGSLVWASDPARPAGFSPATRVVIKKILEVSKMYFRMDFLNTTKKLFSCISGFYNMFIKLQRVLANISKNTKNLILGGIHLLFTLMFG